MGADFSDLKVPEADLKRVSARGGVYSLISQALMVTIQMGTMVVLARLLIPSDFGLFAMVTSVTGFILLFKDLGLSVATVQKHEITHGEVTFLFWINVALSVSISLLMVLVAEAFHLCFPLSRLPGICFVLSLGTFVSGFGTQHQAILNRQMRFRSIALCDVISILLSSFIGIVCAWRGFGYWSLAIMQVAFYLINTITLWALSGWRPGAPLKVSNARELLAFGGHLTGANVMMYLSRNLDNVLIGAIWGPVQVGYYSRAYQLLLQPTLQISALLRSVMVPALSRLNRNPQEFRNLCCLVLAHISRITLPAVTYMLLTSDWIINVILGPQWNPAAVIFSCLGVATLLQPINAATSIILIAQGRTRELFHVLALTSAAMGVAICIGLPWMAVGVALGISLCELLVRTPFLFYAVGRKGPVSSSDLYNACIPGVPPAVAVMAFVIGVRYFGGHLVPLQGLLFTGLGAVAAALLTISFLPGGRAALLQVRYLLLSVLPVRTT